VVVPLVVVSGVVLVGGTTGGSGEASFLAVPASDVSVPLPVMMTRMSRDSINATIGQIMFHFSK
jgi:hypothetical protein